MNRTRFLKLFFVALLFLCPMDMFGGVTQFNGKWSPEQYVPTTSVQEHYDIGMQCIGKKDWDNAYTNFMIIIYHFYDTPFYADSLFYAAVCEYASGELDLANKHFDLYLSSNNTLKHFEDIFDFKYQIALRYRNGVKKHLFGFEKLPKVISAKSDSLLLLDEIIAALPGKELAAKSLFLKSEILRKQKEYKESIDTLQLLARQFPKHAMAADGYVHIAEIYYEQSLYESQNPDLISLAKMNINKFGKSFPGDERIALAENYLKNMQNVYAESLYETGKFYERKKKPKASVIYYRDVIKTYPGTNAANKSQQRLDVLLALK